jgi:microcystin degradation protein MlrC
LIGFQIPIFGVFDLHANFSQRMADNANCLVAYRQNRHTDAREASQIAARLLQRSLISGELPRMVWQHPSLMWPPTGTGTSVDPAAVLQLSPHAIGTKITLPIGGHSSRLDAGPLMLEVELIRLSDGEFELEDKQSHLASMHGDGFDMGRCAVVRHGGLTILLTSHKTPPFDLAQWKSQGLEPTKFSVIAVKAAVAHRRAYDPIADRMLWVNTPGPCTSNLASLPYRRIKRPIFY